jgi:hypothetical protein
MKKFTCTIVWRGSGETAEFTHRVVEAEKANDARKSLTKELRGQGLVEAKDFTITLVEGEDADTPPPPFICGEDW